MGHRVMKHLVNLNQGKNDQWNNVNLPPVGAFGILNKRKIGTFPNLLKYSFPKKT